MGGLVDGSVVKGDLWMIEAGAGNLACYPINPTYEGPGPRVGHASLLVGNAFIVFGGDTKMDDRDRLDDTLYLLNTCESPLASSFGRLLILSYAPLVAVITSHGAPCRSLWTYFEYIRFKNICVRRTSRGILFQRLDCI